jgi:hypothetical protein
LREHHHRVGDEVLSANTYVLALEGEGAGDEANEPQLDAAPVVIAEMATEVPTLSVSEAVMRMDLEDSPALMFRNRAHGGLNMVYRRGDGNVGWVDPRGNRSQD